MLKRIAISFLALGLIVVVGGGLWLYFTTAEIRNLMQFKPEERLFESKGPVLEAEADVAESLVRRFLLFTPEDLSFGAWKKRHNILSKGKKRLLFTEDVELPALRVNSCEDFYCYQDRLPFSKISNNVLNALIGVEDFRFLSHKGVDIKSILRAIIVDLKNLKIVQGGSTITQQVVKNLFLTREKKLSRKLKEIVLAIYMEKSLSKEEILELYLNEVYWGSLFGVRIKGVAAAARFYFTKQVSQVDAYEACLLISLLKGPSFYHPIRHTLRLKKRVDHLFGLLQKKGMLGDLTPKWSMKKWESWKKSLQVKATKKDFLALSLLSKKQGKEAVALHDFEAYSLQKFILEKLQALKEKGFSSKVWIKDLTCKTDCPKPFFFYSRLEKEIKKAMHEDKHAVGSLVKPLIYAYLFREGGILPDDLYSTEPLLLKLPSGSWKPRESSKNLPTEIVAREALMRSRNRPLIRMVQVSGFEALEKYLQQYFPSLKTPLASYPAQILGAIDTDFNTLAAAYEKFIFRECSELQVDEADESKSVLLMMSDPTQTTLARAVKGGLGSLRFFGKTGTTNKGLDTWFVGFNGRDLVLIWTGWEGSREGQKSFRNYGSTTAFPIYQNWLLNRGRRLSELHCGGVVKEL